MPAANLSSAILVTAFTTKTPLSKVEYTTRNQRRVAFQFYDDNGLRELAAGSTGEILIKKKGQHTSAALARATTFTKDGSGASAVYTFRLNLSTAAFDTAFSAEGTEKLTDLVFELTIVENGDILTIPAVPCTVWNRYLQPDEDLPEDTEDEEYPDAPDILTKSGNLSGLANTATARTNLSAASQAAVDAAMTAADTAQSTAATAQVTADAAIPAAEKGQANGVASLGGTGKVPVAQLPDATSGSRGIMRLASDAEALAGSDTEKAITPAALALIAARREPVALSESVYAYDGSYYRIPAIIKTSTGRLLSAVEKRPSTSDDGAIGIAGRYSDDGGITWSAVANIHPYAAPWAYGNPTFVPTSSSRIWLIFHRHHIDDTRALLGAGTGTDIMRLFKSYTDDDGATWSTPVEISSVAEVDHDLQNVGTGTGIVLPSGRLVVARWTQENGMAATDRTCGIIYSDDQGATWAYVEAGTGFEAQVISAGGANVRINARPAASAVLNRVVYLSSNSGTTWGAAAQELQLPDPSNSASEIRLADGRHVFVNSTTRAYRSSLGLRFSWDNGTNWSKPLLLDGNTINYSQLVQLDSTMGAVLYEGEAGSYIYFRSFKLNNRATTFSVGQTLYRAVADLVEFVRYHNPLGSVGLRLTAGVNEYLIRAYTGSETALDPAGGGLDINSVTGGPIGLKVNSVLQARAVSTGFEVKGLPVFGHKYARKTTSQTLNTSTTLTNDSNLQFAYGADEVWHVQIRAVGQCAAAGGVKFVGAWSGGVSGAASGGLSRLSDRQTGAIVDAALPDEEVTMVGTYTTYLIEMDFMFAPLASGTFNFKFAQNTSNGTNTTIGAGSWLFAKRVA